MTIDNETRRYILDRLMLIRAALARARTARTGRSVAANLSRRGRGRNGTSGHSAERRPNNDTRL